MIRPDTEAVVNDQGGSLKALQPIGKGFDLNMEEWGGEGPRVMFFRMRSCARESQPLVLGTTWEAGLSVVSASWAMMRPSKRVPDGSSRDAMARAYGRFP